MMKRLIKVMITILAIVSLSTPCVASVWNGSVSDDWSNLANWDIDAGVDVINPGVPFVSPTVSTLGQTSASQLYLSIGAGLNIVPGGQLTVGTDLVTGIWGNSLPLTMTGGELNMGGYLNMGAGLYEGDFLLSGGTATAANLSIQLPAVMDISGSGTFITPIANLGNVNWWAANGYITAYGGAGTIIIDTTTDPSNIILTAVPEPTTIALLGLGGLVLRRRRK